MNEELIKRAQAMANEFTNEGKSSLGVGTFLSAFNFDPVLFSDLKVEHEDIVWIWEGFLAKGQLTLLSAFWKAGKSCPAKITENPNERACAGTTAKPFTA